MPLIASHHTHPTSATIWPTTVSLLIYLGTLINLIETIYWPLTLIITIDLLGVTIYGLIIYYKLTLKYESLYRMMEINLITKIIRF